MLTKLFTKLFCPIDHFSDGASILYGHRECIRYQDGPRRWVEYDIEFDGRRFIVIPDTFSWKGELSGEIEKHDLNKIRERISQYFFKRGVAIEVR